MCVWRCEGGAHCLLLRVCVDERGALAVCYWVCVLCVIDWCVMRGQIINKFKNKWNDKWFLRQSTKPKHKIKECDVSDQWMRSEWMKRVLCVIDDCVMSKWIINKFTNKRNDKWFLRQSTKPKHKIKECDVSDQWMWSEWMKRVLCVIYRCVTREWGRGIRV